MPGEIWTPGDGVVPIRPDTVEVDIGGLKLQVLTEPPPSEMRVPNISGTELLQLTFSLNLQLMAVLRELLHMQQRLAALESDETPAPAAAGIPDDELASCSG